MLTRCVCFNVEHFQGSYRGVCSHTFYPQAHELSCFSRVIINSIFLELRSSYSEKTREWTYRLTCFRRYLLPAIKKWNVFNGNEEDTKRAEKKVIEDLIISFYLPLIMPTVRFFFHLPPSLDVAGDRDKCAL